jgi:hypothetical protein
MSLESPITLLVNLVRRKSFRGDDKQTRMTQLETDIKLDSIVPKSYSNVGIDHWEETRRKWKAGEVRDAPKEKRVQLDDDSLLLVYNKMVKDVRGFSKPMPLGFCVDALVRGWKSEGMYVDGAENWN